MGVLGRDGDGIGSAVCQPVVHDELDGIVAGHVNDKAGADRTGIAERSAAAGGQTDEAPLEAEWVVIGIAGVAAVEWDGIPDKDGLIRTSISKRRSIAAERAVGARHDLEGEAAAGIATELDAQAVVNSQADEPDDLGDGLVEITRRDDLNAVQVDLSAGDQAILVILATVVETQGKVTVRVGDEETALNGNGFACAAQEVFGAKDGRGAVGGGQQQAELVGQAGHKSPARSVPGQLAERQAVDGEHKD